MNLYDTKKGSSDKVKQRNGLGAVAHSYNLIYLGGKD
jgi:hypothetical protein